MMEETYLMERVKEQLCFVSPDAVADLARSRVPTSSPHRIDYVLPDGVHNLRGFARQPLTAAQVKEQRMAAAAAGQKSNLPQEQVSCCFAFRNPGIMRFLCNIGSFEYN